MEDKFTSERLESVIERISEASRQRLVYFDVEPGRNSLFESKIGGLPYLPRNAAVPKNEDGKELCFFGQFLFDDMPAADINLPPTGLLQVWLLNDRTTGTDSYSVRSAETSLAKQLIYYPDLDRTVTEAEVRARYQPAADGTFPVQGEFAITYYEGEQTHHNSSDNDYREQFIAIWNELYPDDEIEDEEEYYDIVSEELEDLDEFDPEYGNQLGGYPHFFTEDNRTEETGLADYTVTLLALEGDVAFPDGSRIRFAPGAIVYFFMTAADLDRRDFSRIFYTWIY
ncbi:MAG: YwqG family protein [Bacillota bacterium]|nr:YwqG family protein [Bacillota bacterium]